jgi:hypothetical protein
VKPRQDEGNEVNELNELPEPKEANIKAAYFAATRVVWAELNLTARPDEWQAAMDDLWTGRQEDDDERVQLLIEALAEYAGILARKASPTPAEADAAAYEQVWAMVPDTEASVTLAKRLLTSADEVLARKPD